MTLFSFRLITGINFCSSFNVILSHNSNFSPAITSLCVTITEKCSPPVLYGTYFHMIPYCGWWMYGVAEVPVGVVNQLPDSPPTRERQLQEQQQQQQQQWRPRWNRDGVYGGQRAGGSAESAAQLRMLKARVSNALCSLWLLSILKPSEKALQSPPALGWRPFYDLCASNFDKYWLLHLLNTSLPGSLFFSMIEIRHVLS